MSRGSTWWMSAALCFGPLGSLPVQALEESLPASARVRVTLGSETDPAGTGTRLIGRLAEARAASIVLAIDGSETRELRRDQIVRLERSIRPSRKTKGALIGFGIGFAAVFTLAAATTEGECFQSGANAAVCVGGSALLALPAVAVGAIVAPGEQWANVPLGMQGRPTAAGGGRLQLRLVPLVGPRSGVAVVASF